MAKYIKIFFLTLMVSVILYLIFLPIFDGGNYIETVITSIATIIIILLSFINSHMYYLINLIKSKI